MKKETATYNKAQPHYNSKSKLGNLNINTHNYTNTNNTNMTTKSKNQNNTQKSRQVQSFSSQNNEFNSDNNKDDILKELSYSLSESINKLRSNPSYLIPYLENRLKNFKDEYVYVPPISDKNSNLNMNLKSNNNTNIINNNTPILFVEGKKAVEEAINYLSKLTPLYEYSHNNYLLKIASEHSIDLGVNGLISHEGSDGKSLVDRIEKVCDWNGMLSENLEFGSNTCEDILCTWVIDDGVSLRTHRSNLFSDRYKYFGVSVNSHCSEEIVTVVNFAEELYGFNEENPNIIEKTFYLYPSDNDKTKYVNTYLEIDPSAPESTMSVYKSVIIKNINGRASQKTRKIYTLEDGSKVEHES